MEERCLEHQFEPAEDSCRTCGHPFCNECLVYAFGPSEPPYCLSCALAAAGVRSNAGRRPAMSRRDMRRKQREAKKARKAAATAKVDQRPQIDWSVPADSSPAFEWADEDTDARVSF
ncbi:MAG: hypothetical protein R2726_11330 [Acidimicrobiales bacterium]